MINLMISGPQIILILIIPVVGLFFLAYSVGKKVGYNKRTREVENQIE